jgi:hypothetical protein
MKFLLLIMLVVLVSLANISQNMESKILMVWILVLTCCKRLRTKVSTGTSQSTHSVRTPMPFRKDLKINMTLSPVPASLTTTTKTT